MSMRDTLLRELESELAVTRKFLALLPEAHLTYKPHEKSMELNRLAGHIAESIGWGTCTLNTDKFVLNMDEWKPCVPQTGAEAVKVLDEGAAGLRAELAKATDESLGGTWEMVYAGKTVVKEPRIDALRKYMFSHIVHHRAQLGVYYRLLGIAVPGTYGPSADDNPGM
jgi:uncharacterized damage-inducible protein DinB